MTDREQIKVLLIEDDADDYFITRSLLSKTNTVDCKLDWVQSYDEGLDAVTSHAYDVCLVDYRLGAHDGLELLREANERGSDTPMILLTGQGDLEVDLRAMMAGAVDYLIKGQIDAPLLERSIRYARERKRAEQRIREQAALLDKARDAICAFGLDRRVIYWNKSAERLTGYGADVMMKEENDRCLYDHNYDRVDEAWHLVVEEGEWTGELRQMTRDGKELIVESRWTLVRDGGGNPQSILVINTDVTERKKLETQFLRAQRMESIGNLVGGIAHDLGNLLVPILLGVKVLNQRYGEDDKTKRTLEMIRRSAQRGSDMVKQVLAFARGVEGEREEVDVTDVIREVEKITGETFPKSIQVKVDIEDELWPITGDTTQVQQVLMNLSVNARDAMPDGGRLTIEAYNLDVDQRYLRTNLDAKPGRYVCIEVSDTGTGIPQEELDKIFEPFYTTKPSGKGTGLGLSTVYSIVKSHGGFVGVDSETAKGTSFQIYIPAQKTTRLSRKQGEEALREGQGELILVVDDEANILAATREMLEATGYRVITAPHGRAALHVFETRRSEVDAVLTDLMMPEMDGVETITALRALDAGLPIIAVSGVTGSRPQEALQAGADVFISKPFSAEKLTSSLHDLLHQDTERV